MGECNLITNPIMCELVNCEYLVRRGSLLEGAPCEKGLLVRRGSLLKGAPCNKEPLLTRSPF